MWKGFLLICYALGKILGQRIPHSPWVANCANVAPTLRLWLPSIRQLSTHSLSSAKCPSFAHGLGEAALKLMQIDPKIQTALNEINESGQKSLESCYARAEMPLCYVNITSPYQPQATCTESTRRTFLELMGTCEKDRNDLANCLSYDTQTKLVTNEEIFCKSARLAAISSGQAANFNEAEFGDCQALAKLYNACMTYGVQNLGMEADSCLDPLSFNAYCQYDVTLNANNLSLCSETIVPPMVWITAHMPTLAGLLASGQYEEYCRGLEGSYRVWLSKRRGDAITKATAARSILRSTGRLIGHLNKHFASPMMELAEREEALLQQLEEVLRSLARLHATQGTMFQAEKEDLLVTGNSLYTDEMTASKVQQDFKLYVSTSMMEAYQDWARNLHDCQSRHKSLVKFTPDLDSWDRPTFHVLHQFLAKYEAGVQQLAPLQESTASIQLYLNAEATKPFTYADVWKWLSGAGDSTMSIATLDTRDWARESDLIGKIRQVADKSRHASYKALQSWVNSYTSGDALTLETGRSFSAVAQLIEAQLEILNSASQSRV